MEVQSHRISVVDYNDALHKFTIGSKRGCRT